MSKIILVTGASSGIGKATALLLLQKGYTVYGAARSVDKMQDIEEVGGSALALDVTNESQCKHCIDIIIKQQGRLDVLVNNAGFGLFGAVEDTAIEDAKYQFEVNLFGLGRLTQLALPHMRKKGSGTIINMSSMGGKMYTPLGAWYHATKHALEGFSDCLRVEVAQFGIDVVLIEPGIIETEFGDVLLEPMLKRSANTAYTDLAQRVAHATHRSYEKGGGSPATLIAHTIAKAVAAKKPRTRYAAGKYAKLLIWLRLHVPDRVFDWMLMRGVR